VDPDKVLMAEILVNAWEKHSTSTTVLQSHEHKFNYSFHSYRVGTPMQSQVLRGFICTKKKAPKHTHTSPDLQMPTSLFIALPGSRNPPPLWYYR